MDFSTALERIKWGQPMSRAEWNDPALYVFRGVPPSAEQLYIHFANGSLANWIPRVEDLMADDWLDVPRIS